MMRKMGIGALLLAAFGAPVAMADVFTTYTINFAGTGTLPTAGSFTYDQTTPQFSSFLVTWDGLPTFDLTSSANAPSKSGSPSCIDGTADAEASFDLLSGDCNPLPAGYEVFWQGVAAPGSSEFQFRVLNDNPAFDSLTVQAFSSTPLVSMETFASGSWTITAVVPTSPVPEPSSATLMTTLLAVAFMARKRIGQGLRQATRTNR